MLVEVNYTKEVTKCGECPYYYQDIDMGAIIPICTKSQIVLSSPSIISNECPFETETMCNCSDEKTDIINAIQTLKIVKNCWADQIPNEGEKISDADAIKQSIKCLEEYLFDNSIT